MVGPLSRVTSRMRLAVSARGALAIFESLILSLLAALAITTSQARGADVEVDAELVLAVDVSRSMSPNELEIQRRGYAEALSDEDVVATITGGLLGRVAILYVEWAGVGSQQIIVDWSLIGSLEEAKVFAAKVTAKFDPTLRRTSISSVLEFAATLFRGNGFVSHRKIIDISGDGPNNQGRPVLAARANTLAQGIVINGLPLMTKEGMGSRFHLDDLDDYYRNCVTGGPGSFVLPVLHWQQFPAAVRQKLIMELAGWKTPRLIRSAAADRPKANMTA